MNKLLPGLILKKLLKFKNLNIYSNLFMNYTYIKDHYDSEILKLCRTLMFQGKRIAKHRAYWKILKASLKK